MRRFAIFATVLFLLVVIGSRPPAIHSQHRSFCVCMASKASLLMKSLTGTPAPTTTAQVQPQPRLATASAAE